jgi:hypothetical protein
VFVEVNLSGFARMPRRVWHRVWGETVVLEPGNHHSGVNPLSGGPRPEEQR